MKHHLLAGLGLATGLVLGAPAFAEAQGDTFRGKAYASGLCGSCHAVSTDDGASADPTAPHFQDFELVVGTGAEFIEWFNEYHPEVHTAHPKEKHADDIVAYMASLQSAAEE